MVYSETQKERLNFSKQEYKETELLLSLHHQKP